MTLLLFSVLLVRRGALPAFITLPATGVAVARNSQMPCSTLQRRKQAIQVPAFLPAEKQPQNAGEHIVFVRSMKKTKVVPVSVAACAMQDHLLRQVRPTCPRDALRCFCPALLSLSARHPFHLFFYSCGSQAWPLRTASRRATCRPPTQLVAARRQHTLCPLSCTRSKTLKWTIRAMNRRLLKGDLLQPSPLLPALTAAAPQVRPGRRAAAAAHAGGKKFNTK